MRQITSMFAAAIILGGAQLSYSAQPPEQAAVTFKRSRTDSSGAAFRAGMRTLWEDHVAWTRLFIVGAAADLPDKDATTARLLSNKTDIGNAFKPYYGNATGDQLTKLLKEHVVICGDVVTAGKIDDKAKLAVAKKRWLDNADSIAAFLSKVNPENWSEATLREEMRDHLNLTNMQAASQMRGDWLGSIAAYDMIHSQTLGMADMLANGIVKQFPERFK